MLCSAVLDIPEGSSTSVADADAMALLLHAHHVSDVQSRLENASSDSIALKPANSTMLSPQQCISFADGVKSMPFVARFVKVVGSRFLCCVRVTSRPRAVAICASPAIDAWRVSDGSGCRSEQHFRVKYTYGGGPRLRNGNGTMTGHAKAEPQFEVRTPRRVCSETNKREGMKNYTL